MCIVITTPIVAVGAWGPVVRELEAQLARRGYGLAGVDDRYGADTRDAVLAFQKMEGRTRDDRRPRGVAALLDARTPQAARAGTQIEVYKADSRGRRNTSM